MEDINMNMQKMVSRLAAEQTHVLAQANKKGRVTLGLVFHFIKVVWMNLVLTFTNPKYRAGKRNL